jgi:hypothetical protein
VAHVLQRAGSLATVPHIWNDLKIGDQLYRFQPTEP